MSKQSRAAVPCKACGRHISWIETAAGKMMPVDALYSLQVVDDDGQLRRAWLPHWTTCTEPDRFRAGSRRGSGQRAPTFIIAHRIASEIRAMGGDLEAATLARHGIEIRLSCPPMSDAPSTGGSSKAPAQAELSFGGGRPKSKPEDHGDPFGTGSSDGSDDGDVPL